MEERITEVFISVLNMSWTGALVIAAVLCVRALLRKAPRQAVCWLWAAPVFRLLCPVSVTSALSLLGLLGASSHRGRVEYIPSDIGMAAKPAVDLLVPPVTQAVNAALPAARPEFSANPLQIWLFVGACVWLAGTIAMLTAAGVQLLGLRRRLSEAVELEPGVFLADRIDGPFVLGVFRPRIYLPSHLPAAQRGYILNHERAQIRRRDPRFKLLAFAALCLHWFNPLVWVAWRMLCRDIETACDESALRTAGAAERQRYAAVLLEAAGTSHGFPALLAFGESDVAVRIKHTLHSRPVSRAALVAALALAVGLTACFAANPAAEPQRPTQAQAKAALEKYMQYDERRFALFEIEELSYVEPEDWEATGMLDEMIDSQTSWGDCLKADPDCCLWFARTATRYQPETAITAPQTSDGGWERYLLLEPEGDGYRVVSERVSGGMEMPEPPAEHTQTELGLTSDQWTMLQHQMSALVFSGIRRDFDSPSEWTADELAGWVKYRLLYWPSQYEEDPFPLSRLSMLLQADFSPENEQWGNCPDLLPAALEGKTELPLGDPPTMPQDEQVSVQYRREGDTVVAEAVVTDGNGEEMCIQYTFGLVPDIGPVSRTWVQSARVVSSKCPVGESSSSSLAG